MNISIIVIIIIIKHSFLCNELNHLPWRVWTKCVSRGLSLTFEIYDFTVISSWLPPYRKVLFKKRNPIKLNKKTLLPDPSLLLVKLDELKKNRTLDQLRKITPVDLEIKSNCWFWTVHNITSPLRRPFPMERFHNFGVVGDA